MKYVFAGDRQISCNILKFLMEKGYPPSALMVSSGKNASHAEELIRISGLSEKYIFRGNDFKKEKPVKLFKDLSLDYIFGIHFPYIIPTEILNIPEIGFLNLHPAYLPYNKGWHTPSWAILEGKPFGATLHFMSENLDEGDIIHQKTLEIHLSDTADSLYARALQLEEQVFKESFDDLKNLTPQHTKQQGKGTSHVKKDLEAVREIVLDEKMEAKDFIRKLGALTTNNPEEMPYFMNGEKKIGIKVEFIELN